MPIGMPTRGTSFRESVLKGVRYGPSLYAICTTIWLNLDDSPASLRFDRKRRKGRGHLVSVDGWKENSLVAELEPESTYGIDQILTEIAWKSANSDRASHIQREHAKAQELIVHVTSVATPQIAKF